MEGHCPQFLDEPLVCCPLAPNSLGRAAAPIAARACSTETLVHMEQG